MELQVGVKIAIKNKSRKILLLRRNPEKYKAMGKEALTWDIVGGRINPGSPLLENLKREVMEETGITLKGNVKLVAAQDILRLPERHVVRLTYIGSFDTNEQVTLSEEESDYKWFTLKEIKALPKENIDRFLKEVLDNDLVK